MGFDYVPPRSVAVIDASLRHYRIIINQLLRRFNGKLFLINPNYKEDIIENKRLFL